MIIQLESATAGNIEAAKRSLEALASWGYEIAEAPRGDDRGRNHDNETARSSTR